MRWIFALALLIAACQPASNTTTTPDIVYWDRSPQAVLFRADVVGGESAFHARNAVPNCTIYGDNHVVWVNELGPFQIEVLEDRLPDEVVSAFVQYLAANERIYTYQAGRAETPGDDQPVVETVFIDVNNIAHHADSFSGWGADWFPHVLNTCKHLSQTPVLVAPSSGWVSAETVPFSMQPPLVTWDAAQMGLSLSEVVGGTARWISGAGASQLWNMLHSLPSNTIFQDGDSYYQVALQVPGITRDAPPAPE
ncbi:MAG: hypothetical protein U0521_02360 [Anaerolineae bacterium]